MKRIKAYHLWYSAIGSLTICMVVLMVQLYIKNAKIQEYYAKHYRELLNQIEGRSSVSKKHQQKQKRSVASQSQKVTVNQLFSAGGPLQALPTQERQRFRKQVLSHVDAQIRKGSIEPKNRLRFIEIQVIDRQLELLQTASR